MPYIKQERRAALDKVVDELVKSNLKRGSIELFLLNLANHYNARYLMGIEQDLKKVVEISDEIGVEPNGDINYILFKYCKYHIEPSYNNYKSFMGEIYKAVNNIIKTEYKDEFREAAEWIRIKLLTPYEEEKILTNGDV